MDNRIVIFSPDGVKIKHGVNLQDFAGRTDVLINPEYPRDAEGHVIPPHLWTLKNGQITSPKTAPHPAKTLSKLQYYLLGVVSGILLSIAFAYLRRIL